MKYALCEFYKQIGRNNKLQIIVHPVIECKTNIDIVEKIDEITGNKNLYHCYDGEKYREVGEIAKIAEDRGISTSGCEPPYYHEIDVLGDESMFTEKNYFCCHHRERSSQNVDICVGSTSVIQNLYDRTAQIFSFKEELLDFVSNKIKEDKQDRRYDLE